MNAVINIGIHRDRISYTRSIYHAALYVLHKNNKVSTNYIVIEPRHKKPEFLPMRKHRRSNCTADQRICFRYTDGTFPLLLKFESF